MGSIAYSTTNRSRELICGIALLLFLVGVPCPANAQVISYSSGPDRFSFRDGWESNTFDYEMQVQRDRYITLYVTFDTLSLVGFFSGMFLYDFLAVDYKSGIKAKDILLSSLSGAALATPFVFGKYYFLSKANKLTLQASVDQIPRQPEQNPTYTLAMTMRYRF